MHRRRVILMTAASQFERFANSEYGVTADELSAACVVDVYGDRFEVCRKGGPLLLPRSTLDFMCRMRVIKRPNIHTVCKYDVDWQRFKELQAIRQR